MHVCVVDQIRPMIHFVKNMVNMHNSVEWVNVVVKKRMLSMQTITAVCFNTLISFKKKFFLVTLIGSEKGENGVCPLHAQDSSGICTCNDGYRVQNDSNRACGKKKETKLR